MTSTELQLISRIGTEILRRLNVLPFNDRAGVYDGIRAGIAKAGVRILFEEDFKKLEAAYVVQEIRAGRVGKDLPQPKMIIGEPDDVQRRSGTV